MRLVGRPALALSALALAGCRSHDAARELAASRIETYWVVDSPQGNENFISPAVRFRLKNVSSSQLGSVQARARFGVPGQSEPWGSIQEQVSTWRKPLAPGQDTTVTVRSVGRYHSAASPDDLFRSPGFRDPRVEIFVRIGASPWGRLGEAAVERRIGAPETMRLGAP